MTELARRYEARKSKAIERAVQTNIFGETSVAATLGFLVGGPAGAIGFGLAIGFTTLLSQDHEQIGRHLEKDGAIA